MQQHCLYLDDGLLTGQMCVCSNFLERGRGLLWRPHLDAVRGEALLIPHCNSVHTFWMSYRIAVIFLDAAGRITRICPDVPPWRVVGCRQARFALECAVGTAWALGLHVGQQLRWRELTKDMRGIHAGRCYSK